MLSATRYSPARLLSSRLMQHLIFRQLSTGSKGRVMQGCYTALLHARDFTDGAAGSHAVAAVMSQLAPHMAHASMDSQVGLLPVNILQHPSMYRVEVLGLSARISCEHQC